MSEKIVVKGGGGIGILGATFLVLLTLKLLGKIDWSWWVVAAPLWGPLAMVLIAVVGVFAASIAYQAMRRM